GTVIVDFLAPAPPSRAPEFWERLQALVEARCTVDEVLAAGEMIPFSDPVTCSFRLEHGTVASCQIPAHQAQCYVLLDGFFSSSFTSVQGLEYQQGYPSFPYLQGGVGIIHRYKAATR